MKKTRTKTKEIFYANTSYIYTKETKQKKKLRNVYNKKIKTLSNSNFTDTRQRMTEIFRKQMYKTLKQRNRLVRYTSLSLDVIRSSPSMILHWLQRYCTFNNGALSKILQSRFDALIFAIIQSYTYLEWILAHVIQFIINLNLIFFPLHQASYLNLSVYSVEYIINFWK